jgi:hypothetical protein
MTSVKGARIKDPLYAIVLARTPTCNPLSTEEKKLNVSVNHNESVVMNAYCKFVHASKLMFANAGDRNANGITYNAETPMPNPHVVSFSLFPNAVKE